jgi:signal transduction histidine kinase
MVAVSAAGTFAAASGLLFSGRFEGKPTVMLFGGLGMAVAGWCLWQLWTDRLFPVAVMMVVAASMGALGVFTDHGFRLAIAAILVLYAAVGAVIIADTGGFWAFTIFVGAVGGFNFVASRLGWVAIEQGESPGDLLIEGIVFWTAAWVFRKVRDEIVTRDQHQQSKDVFLARVAHELRTPLTSVLGYAELIAKDPAAPPEVREQAEVIADEGRAMAAVIDDFTLVSRTDDDLLTLKPVTILVQPEVARAVASVPATTIHIHTTGSTTAVVHADPDRLRQMLRVLIANAVQHATSVVEVAVSEDEDTTIIEIIDDGAGLAGTDMTTLVEAYHHTHTEPGQPERLGLGLFVAHRLAQAMAINLSWDRDRNLTVFRLLTPNGAPQSDSGQIGTDHPGRRPIRNRVWGEHRTLSDHPIGPNA